MTAPTPGQVPEAYYRWCQVNQPANWTAPRDLVEAMWAEKTAAEQEFWRSLDAAQEPRPAPGRQARQLDAALRGLAQIREHVEDEHRKWPDVELVVSDVISEINEIADGKWMAPATASQARRHEAQAAPGDLRMALESLAAFWVREYVTGDGWPDVCAKQLLDVLGGAREPKPAPELAAALAEPRELRKVIAELLGMFRAVSGGWGARTSSSRLRRIAARAMVPWDEFPPGRAILGGAPDSTYRDELTELIDELEASSQVTSPSKKTDIERGLIGRLQDILEGK